MAPRFDKPIRDCTSKVLPSLFSLMVLGCVIVILIYSHGNQEPIPPNVASGLTITLGIIASLFALGHTYMYFRRDQSPQDAHDVERGVQSPTRETHPTMAPMEPQLRRLESDNLSEPRPASEPRGPTAARELQPSPPYPPSSGGIPDVPVRHFNRNRNRDHLGQGQQGQQPSLPPPARIRANRQTEPQDHSIPLPSDIRQQQIVYRRRQQEGEGSSPNGTGGSTGSSGGSGPRVPRDLRVGHHRHNPYRYDNLTMYRSRTATASSETPSRLPTPTRRQVHRQRSHQNGQSGPAQNATRFRTPPGQVRAGAVDGPVLENHEQLYREDHKTQPDLRQDQQQQKQQKQQQKPLVGQQLYDGSDFGPQSGLQGTIPVTRGQEVVAVEHVLMPPSNGRETFMAFLKRQGLVADSARATGVDDEVKGMMDVDVDLDVKAPEDEWPGLELELCSCCNAKVEEVGSLPLDVLYEDVRENGHEGGDYGVGLDDTDSSQSSPTSPGLPGRRGPISSSLATSSVVSDEEMCDHDTSP